MFACGGRAPSSESSWARYPHSPRDNGLTFRRAGLPIGLLWGGVSALGEDVIFGPNHGPKVVCGSCRAVNPIKEGYGMEIRKQGGRTFVVGRTNRTNGACFDGRRARQNVDRLKN